MFRCEGREELESGQTRGERSTVPSVQTRRDCGDSSLSSHHPLLSIPDTPLTIVTHPSLSIFPSISSSHHNRSLFSLCPLSSPALPRVCVWTRADDGWCTGDGRKDLRFHERIMDTSCCGGDTYAVISLLFAVVLLYRYRRCISDRNEGCSMVTAITGSEVDE